MVAVLVGLYAVLRVGRWIVGLAWSVRGIDEALPWIAEHWALVALVLLGTFALAVLATRFVLPRLSRGS